MSSWERYNIAGQQALSAGKPLDAETQFKLAIQEAESMGPNEPKIATSMSALANAYRQQGKYADAEPMYKKAVETMSRIKGPTCQELIPIYDNYAKMLRAAGRGPEADKMDAKARAIFAR
jgi:tetratricopeptide (TPR) repeat protein